MFPILFQIQVQLPHQNPVVVIVVVAVLLAAVIYFVVSARVNVRGKTPTSSQVKFTRGRFRRLARSYGLNPVQTRTLENLVQRYRTLAPYAVFSSPPQLDILLKKAIAEVQAQSQTEEVKQAHIATLYRIKQTIEQNNPRGRQPVSGSSQLRAGQPVSISDETGARYASRVVTRLKDSFAVEVPIDEMGNQVRWKKWANVQIFVPRGAGKGVSFQTKVTGYNLVKGLNSVLLQHTNAVSQAAQRKFRRKQIDRPCYFYLVQIMTVGSGRDARKQAVPQTNGALGTMLDVSSGGCSLKTTFPLPRGSLVKIEFETDRKRTVTAYGKVRHVRKAAPMGGVMHIQFTRVSRQSLNTINSYVYEL